MLPAFATSSGRRARLRPSIIFIDELDAIGRTRGSGAQLGGHDEREQTLNQILTEMDGFDSRQGVIVLAATNRADVLDLALLRPGRFDRRVVVQRPDRAGRAAILKVHTRNVPLAPDVSLERIAAETPGLVGAELRNLVNEAALLAARKDADAVRAEDFAEAMEKITLGPARNILLNPADRERTAYHEAGHALVALLVPDSDPVHRISIIPRGMALGATYMLPVDDRTSYAEDYLRARITGALGGSAAEKLVYGVVTSGAENDLQQVTEIARDMVLRWGMSEKLGPISFVAPRDEGLPPAFRHQPYSDATSEVIDAEVRRHRRAVSRRSRSALGRPPERIGCSREGATQGRIPERERDPGTCRPGWASYRRGRILRSGSDRETGAILHRIAVASKGAKASLPLPNCAGFNLPILNRWQEAKCRGKGVCHDPTRN